MLPPQTLSLQIATISDLSRVSLQRYLRRCFPTACLSLVEDAVEDAIVDAMVAAMEPSSAFCRALAEDGPAGVRRVLRRAAWCHLRGHFRRSATRHECKPEEMPETVSLSSPYSLLLRRELMAQVDELVESAALLHAKRNPEPLRAALVDALISGDPLTHVADRNEVRREPLNYARNWVESQLRT